MKSDISILVPNISSNILGASTMLARLLDKEYRVQIVGPDFGEGISPMYQDAWEYTTVDGRDLMRLTTYRRGVAALQQALTGRCVLAVKSYMDTVPVAVDHQRKTGIPALVYLDEWDGALWRRTALKEKARQLIREPHYMLGDFQCAWSERWIPEAQKVLCSTTFLADKFNGECIHFGVDHKVFQPSSPEKRAALKKELGLNGKRLVVFGGVVRPHKGVDEVIEALDRMALEDVVFLVIGPETPYLKKLIEGSVRPEKIRCTGAVSREAMPAYLDLADVLPITLRDDVLAQSQMPCKLFEAMAMAKPIIATAVSDVPLVLGETGWMIPPDDPPALEKALHYCLENPEEAAVKGQAARERLISTYSLNQSQDQLIHTFRGVLES